jgi:MFS family permease
VQGISWHWIFWINVPIGLVLLPLAAARLRESRGPYGSLDLPGLALASTGAFGVVFGLVRAQSLGWTSPAVLVSLLGGAALLAGFVAWERRAREPMLPMAFFSRRAFAVTNFASLTMYFGMFGSIFFLSQFMQNVLHNTPLQAGLKILVWTGATMITAPLAGVYSQRFGSRPFMLAGLTLQAGALAWLAAIIGIDTPYAAMIVPFVMAGAGMALVFAPSAAAVLSAVRGDQAGQASGAANAIRETGGVLGVAVLASVFTGAGGYGSAQAFVAGVVPAMWVGVAVLALGALAVLVFPFQTLGAQALAAAEASGRGEETPRPMGGSSRPAGLIGEAA